MLFIHLVSVVAARICTNLSLHWKSNLFFFCLLCFEICIQTHGQVKNTHATTTTISLFFTSHCLSICLITSSFFYLVASVAENPFILLNETEPKERVVVDENFISWANFTSTKHNLCYTSSQFHSTQKSINNFIFEAENSEENKKRN